MKLASENFVRGKRKKLGEAGIPWKINKVISDDKEASPIFYRIFFVNIVPSHRVSSKENYEVKVGHDNEQIINYINKF